MRSEKLYLTDIVDLVKIIMKPDGSLLLVPKVAIDRSQAYFWTKCWQQAERVVEEDLQEGRYQDFDTMEELLCSLQDDMADS